MTLKKPSDIFGKKHEDLNIKIVESDNSFRDELVKVENLSDQIIQLQQELSQKVIQSDLEKLFSSQIFNIQENFQKLQNDFKKSNKEDIGEFRERVSEISEIVANLIENEIPKYKKQITGTEVRIGERFSELKDIVENSIIGIREEIDTQVNDIAEIIDNNLEIFNRQIQENSFETKKTTDTYNKLSNILESKVSKENEKLEEYSKVIQSIHEEFIELEKSLQEETLEYNQIIEDKFETISSNINIRIESIDENINNKIAIIGEGVDTFKSQVSSEVSNIKADVVIFEKHNKNIQKDLEIVEGYIQNHHKELVELKEEVFGEIQQLPLGNLQENLERLEKKIDYIKETYSKIEPEVIVKEVIKEGLLNEPPDKKNSDPLTPLDQNFVTLDQLQQHYRLFINRIQQQISTIGGGGETRLKYLDDIVGIATNASAYDGKFLKYNHNIGKFEFVTVSGGGGSQTLDTTLGLGNTSSLGMSVGVVTATSFSGSGTNLTGIVTSIIAGTNVTISGSTGQVTINASGGGGGSSQWVTTDVGIHTLSNVGIGTTNPTSKLHVVGDARITGILTIGTSSIVLDGTDNKIYVGSGVTISPTEISIGSNIIGSGGFSGNASSATFATNAGVSTYSDNAGIATYATNAGVSTYATNAGIATYATYATNSGIATYATNSGISTYATYATNAGIATYATNAGIATYATNAGIATYATNAGIATFATNAGIATYATYATNAGIATYATNAGIATYATNAGVSTYSDNAGIATYATNAGIATYATNAGIATYATNAGIATYATNAGVSTYSDNAGIATYATNAGIATFATNAGVSTYATNAGIATFATNAGVSTYSDNAGIATYATNAGIATSVIGGIVSVTQLNVSGISTFTSGPVFIGAAISTGTALQRLQVTDGAYVSGSVGIGTTNPTSKLQVQGDVSVLGIITATQFSTGASGTGVNISTDTISGPSLLYIDPAAVGDNTGAVRIKGDLYVDGTQFIVNSTTIEFADFNVGIATTVGTNALLDGAGIGIGSTGIRKTLTWSNSSTSLKSSEDFDVASGKVYKINGTSVLSNNTLGSDIVTSSLTSVGTLTNLSVGNVYSSGIVTTLSLRGYSALVGTASSTTTTFVVTVASKTTNHRYFGTGSGSAYFIDGIESPFLTLLPGKTYRFTQEDGTNSSHPILFYYQADKTTGYTTNVTTTGTPGSVGAYTEIVVTDTTPVVLHYQCSNHGYMGNAAQFSSSVVDTPYQITARSGINVTGVVTATTFVGALTGTATTAQGLTGTPNLSVGVVTATSFSGSGIALTGIVTSIIAGTNVTVSGSTGQVTINASGGGGGSSQWVTTDVGIHTLSNVGIGTTNPTSKLTVVGVVSATSFSGSGAGLTSIPAGQLTGALPAIDGSALTGIVAGGSGVVIRDDGSPVGTATTIDFGTNLSVSFASGIATITASGGGSQTLDTTLGLGNTSSLGMSVGVVTATSFSGSGTALTGIVTSIIAGTNVTVSGSTGQVTINSTASGGGGGAALDLLEVMLFT